MGAADATPATSHDGSSDHAEHARDHCALTGLAVCAVVASAGWNVVDWAGTAVPLPHAIGDAALSHDASARWLTLRLHAPPIPA